MTQCRFLFFLKINKKIKSFVSLKQLFPGGIVLLNLLIFFRGKVHFYCSCSLIWTCLGYLSSILRVIPPILIVFVCFGYTGNSDSLSKENIPFKICFVFNTGVSKA